MSRVRANDFAARQGMNWSESETDYLKEKWGELSCEALALALGRSPHGVADKACSLGLGRSWDNTADVSLFTIFCVVFGRKPGGNSYAKLKRMGLKVRARKFGTKTIHMVSLAAFWKWAETNKDSLSFLKFEKNGLGAEPDWADAKRKSDWKTVNDERYGLSNEGKCVGQRNKAGVA